MVVALLIGCATNDEKVVKGNQIFLNFDQAELVINKDVYGHFAEHLGRCVYDGIWVGPDSDIPNYKGYRLDVLEALKELQVPVLRWPGGCFADTYNWKDGVGPRSERPKLVNVFWGGDVEDNSFGTHEFLELCQILGADAYIAANVGSGSVREMIEWIEYMTSDQDIPMANWRRENGREEPWDVKFLGIGNESWGCGGEMTPEFYVNLMRQYSVFARQYGGSDMIRVGCGSHQFYYHWTEVLMREGRNHMEALSLHYYTIPTGDWGIKSEATGFDEDLYFSALRNALRMDELLKGHIEIMDRYDPEGRVELYMDEWGIWTDPEPGTNPAFLHQQNSMRDALIASLTFDIFHRHARRVQMANIAQMVNVLQAMILTDGDRMILTPTYHVFNMYKFNQNATYIPVEITTEKYAFENETIPAITGTASTKDGKVFVGLSNLHASETLTIDVDISGGNANRVLKATILTAPEFNSHNTYDNPNVVAPAEFAGYELTAGNLQVVIPPYSVVTFEME
ncbi:alpha-N-arabinofuranosidase [Alkalitalea saponilacus]|nr:alpha-N-arabinofuranosidase [Alkalitalea saponilacus]